MRKSLYISTLDLYELDVPSKFHAEVRLWSEIKHDILRKYLRLFVNKLGAAGRVYYVDGFAGQGKYDDGKEGSALIAARLVRKSQPIKGARVAPFLRLLEGRSGGAGDGARATEGKQGRIGMPCIASARHPQ